MELYLAGNFVIMGKKEKEKAFQEQLEHNCFRLAAFYYKKEIDIVVELKGEELKENKYSLLLTELKKWLKYNPATGIFIWIKSPHGRIKVGDVAGSNMDGYVQIVVNQKAYLAHRLAWLFVYGYLPENMIDHKDQVKHHNWIDNLREASNQCNQRNTGNPKSNSSGVKGVCWNVKNGRWKSSIKIKGETKYLGLYDSFDNAVCARLAGEQCVDWSGCDNSSPAYLYVKNNIQGDELNGETESEEKTGQESSTDTKRISNRPTSRRRAKIIRKKKCS